MCRWIAYRGETITLERYVTAPAHSLVVQSIRSLEAAGPTNGDGFGLGWYDQHDAEPGLYREVRPAWSDENLRHLCRHIRSHLFFAHVRASTGTPTTRPNCHPFAYGRYLFMHNGQIGDWSLIRRRVEALIPDTLYKARIGTTDSEAVFLAILCVIPAEPEAVAVGRGVALQRPHALHHERMRRRRDVAFEFDRVSPIGDPAAHGPAPSGAMITPAAADLSVLSTTNLTFFGFRDQRCRQTKAALTT